MTTPVAPAQTPATGDALVPLQARADYQRLRADLHARGYRDLADHDTFTVGDRVRHQGAQYPEAYRNGTATVLAVTERAPSSWSTRWDRRDIELLVVVDRALPGGSRIRQWADYHTAPIQEF